jgi:histone H3/H4
MAKAATKKEVPMMVVASKMKDYAKQSEMRVSGDFIDALNGTVATLVDDAVRRCKGNGRSTLRPDDL